MSPSYREQNDIDTQHAYHPRRAKKLRCGGGEQLADAVNKDPGNKYEVAQDHRIVNETV